MSDVARPFTKPTPETVRAFVESVPMYRDDVDDPMFWPDERLRARRDELLQRQLGWVSEASAFYRRRFDEEGVDVAKVRSTDDLVHLPVTTKQDLMSDPKAFRLAFPQPGLYDLTYATVYTTGTTMGLPTPYEYTTHDFMGVLLSGRRNYKVCCMVPGDTFLTAFPLSPLPHVSGFGGLTCNAAGLRFMHGFTGPSYPEFPVHNASSVVSDYVERARPEGLAGVGSFLRRMFADAAREGRDFSSLKVVFASGEVLTARMREHMHENLDKLGATETFITGTYGFTEGGVGWAPCHEGGPLHATAPDQVFLEILDAETHERLPDGEPGLVALTHLNRRGMPLVRYLLGDISAVSHEPCLHCGRRGESLLVASGSAHVSRTSELMKIKGTLVNPQVIHDVVMNTAGVVEYQLLVRNRDEGDPLSPDRLVLRVGIDPSADRAGWEAGGDRVAALREAVFNSTEVHPDVELVANLSDIYDPTRDFKARRIVDERAPLE